MIPIPMKVLLPLVLVATSCAGCYRLPVSVRCQEDWMRAQQEMSCMGSTQPNPALAQQAIATNDTQLSGFDYCHCVWEELAADLSCPDVEKAYSRAVTEKKICTEELPGMARDQ